MWMIIEQALGTGCSGTVRNGRGSGRQAGRQGGRQGGTNCRKAREGEKMGFEGIGLIDYTVERLIY